MTGRSGGRLNAALPARCITGEPARGSGRLLHKGAARSEGDYKSYTVDKELPEVVHLVLSAPQ